MARRVRLVPITGENRDSGKTFRLTEMPSNVGEKWAIRAFLALAKSGIELPDGTAEAGMAGIASVGFKKLFSNIPFDEAEYLMDEMFKCVRFQHNPADEEQGHRAMIEADIEEISTRLKLRLAIFELHTGFSMGAKQLTTGFASRPTDQATP